MDPATATLIVAAFQLILIPIAGGIWYYYRDRVQNEKLREAIDVGIRAAEEKSLASEKNGDSKWSENEKLDFVWRYVEKQFPKLNAEKLEAMIHAFIQAIPGIGATK